ncbi:MAG: lipocalin family protein [Gammaproteobacteria bacterium]
MKSIYSILIITILVGLNGCVSVPSNITPVSDFELNRYLGKWYEIARLDHSFERGLEHVSAEYSLRDDGGVAVKNRGYDKDKKEWNEAVGKAYFVNDVDKGHLKVSFFGPFYGSYIIFELDHEDYQYAFISGPNLNYLWFLSRTPKVDQSLIDHFKEQADKLGFNIDELIFVNQIPE